VCKEGGPHSLGCGEESWWIGTTIGVKLGFLDAKCGESTTKRDKPPSRLIASARVWLIVDRIWTTSLWLGEKSFVCRHQHGHQGGTNISKERKIPRIPLRRGPLVGIIEKFGHEGLMHMFFSFGDVQWKVGLFNWLLQKRVKMVKPSTLRRWLHTFKGKTTQIPSWSVEKFVRHYESTIQQCKKIYNLSKTTQTENTTKKDLRYKHTQTNY